ncbi:penicillin-binding protein 1B [Wohlfahrtiimonas chitiniclastica]|uniref:penicillin-binding protein 1B n=1 Tax=Wohlfahrtiimonas chitiniclastica TaxID=400946 RepID=UPI001FEFFA98|nr:penicillin-binding protein 1B [Wohlfahrtiimonas chitiniclastica]
MKLTLKKRTVGSRINAALRYFLRLVIYMIVGGAFLMIPIFFYYLIKTNQELGTQFEDRSWSIPARVYARPLELYVGKPIKKADLLLELEMLHYKKTAQLNQPGTYNDKDGTINIYLREFTYSDQHDPAQKIQVTISGNTVKDLKSNQEDQAKKIDLIRVEPLHIASIYPAHNEDRILLKREEIPQLLVDTLLAMEDRQFYDHMGVNPKAIIRAMVANMKAGRKEQGGSTLTQQLIKNYFLTPAQTYERKIQEMFYALIIDWRYPKDDVLEAYMNEIYLGQDGARAIHGFGLASEFFFGKPVTELSINNIATLVGVIPSPSAYNPRKNPKLALKRRNLVLDVMAKQNLLSEAEVEALKQEPLDVLEQAPSSGITKYPAFVDLVTRQLKELYASEDLTTEGLKVFTTLDPIVQTYAEKAVIDTLPVIEKTRGVKNIQAAIIIAQNNTGEVEALVGDRQVRQAGFNRALSAKRQIGSLIKPFIYLRALEEPQRFSLATLLDDETPFEMNSGGKKWSPKNYDRRLHGWIPLITALAKSYNIPTIRLGLDVGVDSVIDTLYRLGLNPTEYNFPAVPSTLLGAIDITVFDVTQMYSTIANDGYYIPLKAIREVTQTDGTVLAQNLVAPKQAIFPGPNYLITRAMQNVVDAGTGGGLRRAGIKARVAGKTGTTNNYRDAWFAGFSGDRTAVAWVGKDDNTPVGRVGGATGGLPVWAAAMKNLILEDISNTPPKDIVNVRINTATGLPPPNYACPDMKTMTLPFIRGYQPTYPGDCDFYPPDTDFNFDDAFGEFNFDDFQ